MHDPFRVRIVQRVGDLDGDLHDFGCLERSLADALAERSALDVLHREKPEVLVLSDLVNRGDVRMRQCGRKARLLHEAVHTLGIGSDLRRQYLQRDAPPESRVVGQVDGAHAALTKLRNYAIVSD